MISLSYLSYTIKMNLICSVVTFTFAHLLYFLMKMIHQIQ